MNKSASISVLFALAAGYDGLLGAAFLVAGPQLFEALGLTPVHHFGYIQFSAALLVVFALMFGAIAVNPESNRNLIPYGMLLKISYVGVVGWYWITTPLPYVWKPFVMIDLLFLLAFAWAFHTLKPAT